jgi:hypothetical protein
MKKPFAPCRQVSPARIEWQENAPINQLSPQSKGLVAEQQPVFGTSP